MAEQNPNTFLDQGSRESSRDYFLLLVFCSAICGSILDIWLNTFPFSPELKKRSALIKQNSYQAHFSLPQTYQTKFLLYDSKVPSTQCQCLLRSTKFWKNHQHFLKDSTIYQEILWFSQNLVSTLLQKQWIYHVQI